MDLFGTAGIRGDVREVVDPELAVVVGRAAAVGADGGEFALGYDGRTTSPGLADAVAAGLESGGADVVRVGQVPTPALAFASLGRKGVMITASHNPPTDNGIKVFTDGVEYDGEAEAAIERLVDRGLEPVAWDEWGRSRESSILERYREAVCEYTRELADDPEPLSGQRVAIDSGTGVSGLATPQVLASLGATPIALNANVDGAFPARESKPTPESLASFRSFVADGDHDLGIAHDGDGDRIVAVDPDGDVIHEDTVLAILAERSVRESAAEDPVVVTTPNASARIDERVRAAGGRTERVALGSLHEGIARERAAGDDRTAVVFAGEPWKHVHTAFGGWIDAIASAAVFATLVAEAGDAASLREPITERPYRKTSVSCPDAAKAAVMERLRTRLPERFPEGDLDTEYGVRIELPDAAWILVRPSGTEPYVRIYAESEDVDHLIDTVVDAVEDAVDAVASG